MSVQEYSPDRTAGAATPADIVAAVERASTRRTTPNGAGEVVWHIWGKGDPVVLVHGGTGSWRHWIRNIEYLARDFQIIAPDIPGSGDSSSPEPPITAESVARPITEGIKTILGPDQGYAIAGFSMGGLVASYVAYQSGGQAESLVLVSSSGTNLPRAEMEPLHSWRRLPTEAQKREAHRKNYEHPDDPRPRQDRRPRALCAGREFHALARARQARFDHRHARAKSGRLQRKTRRHLGRVRLHVGALFPERKSSCRIFNRDRRSQSFPMPDIGCNTRRMTPSIRSCATC